MKGFVLAVSLLASVHGLGDVFPLTVLQGGAGTTNVATYGDQAVDGWLLGQCSTGTNQSPIDIIASSATIPTVDPGVPALSGYDHELVLGVLPSVTDLTVEIHIANGPARAPMLSGGPLSGRCKSIAKIWK